MSCNQDVLTLAIKLVWFLIKVKREKQNHENLPSVSATTKTTASQDKFIMNIFGIWTFVHASRIGCTAYNV